MKNKFIKYDIVKITSRKPALREILGKEGIINDFCPSDISDTWRYGVSVYGDDDGLWEIYEDDLQATGKKASPEELSDYGPSGTTVTVLVDPDTGEGSFKDPDWFEKLDDDQK